MRLLRPLPPRFAWLVVFLGAFLVAPSSQAQQTTITGTVYTPRSTANPNPDPIPNILVFIAPTGSTLPDINHGGVGVNGGCTAQAGLVGVTPVVYTTTDYKGNFTLSGPALDALGSGTVNLVVQAGKWRRQFPNTNIVRGTANSLGSLYMPSSALEGDLPRIAVVTGSVDSIECILNQMGIAPSEVTASSGSGHVNLFPGTQNPGARVAGSTDTEAGLMLNSTRLNSYDMVMFGCQGTPTDPTVTASTTGLDNLDAYANSGGRIFATHYEYVWLNKPQTFLTAAQWLFPDPSATPSFTGTGTISIDTSYPDGQTLAQWMQYIGASGAAGFGKIPNVQNLRQDQKGVNPPTRSWGTLDPPYSTQAIGTPVMQFSFDTPLNQQSSASVALAFANTPQVWSPGDAADWVVVNVTNTSNTAAPGLVLTLAIPGGFTPVSIAGATPTSGWSCNLGTLTCAQTGYLAAGASDAIKLVLAVDPNVQGGKATLSATVSGVGLTTNNQCGRVLFNEYHVEGGSGFNATYPNECSASVTPAEKFLEFSLYNLSNFIAPSNTDTLLIQVAAAITWTPPATIYYGAPIDGSLLNATANTTGTFTYSYAPAVSSTPVPVGTYSVTATFVPDDTTTFRTTTVTRQIQVVPDPTVSTISRLDQHIFYGEEIGYNNGVDAGLNVNVQSPPGYPIAVSGGTFTATIDGIAVCTGTEGQPLTGGTRPGTCPDSAFLGWDAGTHQMQLTYAGTTSFLPSQSPSYPVVISPDPTTTTIAASQTSVQTGTAITYTATVTDAYTPAIGPVTFYDDVQPTAAVAESLPNVNPVVAGMTPIGTGTLSATGNTVSLTVTKLLPGTHNISACFLSPVNKSGTWNFLNSCSASVAAVVVAPPDTPLATATTLKSSANPSAQGQTITFTANAQTTGPFVQTPTGTVTFLDGTTTLGTATLSGGAATFSTSALTLGTHTITARYSGSTTMVASTSASLTQLITQPLVSAGDGFLLTVTPGAIPVYVGSSGVATVQVTGLNNFHDTVQLTCSGLPAQASCTFAMPTLPAGGGTTQILVTSAAPHDCNNSTPYFASLGGRGLLGFGALCCGTLAFARRRRVLQGIALAGLLLVLPGALTGCGTGNCTDFAVKPGDYAFTIKAVSTGAYNGTRTQTMTMHVHL